MKNQIIHSLAGIIGQRETSVIGAVVDEITASAREQYGLKLMPPVSYPVELIYHEKVSGFGGILAERVIGEPGKNSAVSSSEVIEFRGGAYQEVKKFNEQDLRSLRALGSMGDRGVTGVTSKALDWLSRAGMDLQVKLTNRLNFMVWETIFTGKYTYLNSTKADFAVPLANTFQTTSDWSTALSSTPLKDLYDLQKTNPGFRKYKVLEYVMNPVTVAAILNSAEVRAVLVNHAGAYGDVNKVASILYPELAPIKEVSDSYQAQTVVNGLIVNGATQYFVPDWKILAVPDFSGTLFGLYGELQLTNNINDPSATLDSPAMGIYTFVDEKGLLERKSPYVEVVTGFNGGPNLMRSNDVLIIKTKVGV